MLRKPPNLKHRTLTRIGVPRRKDGNKLGMRKRNDLHRLLPPALWARRKQAA